MRIARLPGTQGQVGENRLSEPPRSPAELIYQPFKHENCLPSAIFLPQHPLFLPHVSSPKRRTQYSIKITADYSPQFFLWRRWWGGGGGFFFSRNPEIELRVPQTGVGAAAQSILNNEIGEAFSRKLI